MDTPYYVERDVSRSDIGHVFHSVNTVWRIYDRREGHTSHYIAGCSKPEDAYKIVCALNAMVKEPDK